MIRTRVREIIEFIRKHPKMRRILRCESPIFITGPYTATRRDVRSAVIERDETATIHPSLP